MVPLCLWMVLFSGEEDIPEIRALRSSAPAPQPTNSGIDVLPTILPPLIDVSNSLVCQVFSSGSGWIGLGGISLVYQRPSRTISMFSAVCQFSPGRIVQPARGDLESAA